MTGKTHLGLARILILLVLAVNVQCALAFIFSPAGYSPSFELSGAAGSAAVQGSGILFLMWNVPYAFAASHPVHRRISLIEALAMQSIGLIGESLLLAALPPGHPALVQTLSRFIIFDAAGLALLVIAFVLTLPPALKTRLASPGA